LDEQLAAAALARSHFSAAISSKGGFMFASLRCWRQAWPALLTVGLAALPLVGQARPRVACVPCLPVQSYTAWERDPAFVENTWKSYFFYAMDESRRQYECQVCYWHDTEGYRHWVYYYNPRSGKFWGKCASPSNPLFTAQRPVWATSADGGATWGPLLTEPPPLPGKLPALVESPPPPPTP
jgi:hypothetical protein